MMAQRSPGWRPGQGGGQHWTDVDTHFGFITSPAESQPTRFDHELSRQIDRAVADADAHNLAAIDAWQAARHFPFAATKHADRRDQALADIVYLESRMPDLEGNDDHDLD